MAADEKSAGAVVFFRSAETAEPEFLLLHYTAGHWDFPKGNIERGEDEEAATIREIREETGITDIEFVEGFKDIIEYRYMHKGRLIHKQVTLFLCRTNTQQVTISHEHIGYAWKKLTDAMRQLSYKNAKNILQAASNHLAKSY